ncbi:MAG: ABC transporter ATP-binding protein/permease [Coprobacillus sp.]
MFDRRLLKEIPESKQYVQKQVVYQWLALIMNIINTILISVLCVSVVRKDFVLLDYSVLFIGIIVCLFIRAYLLKKANQCSFLGASFVKKMMRQRILRKVICLYNHYQENVSTGELLQLSVEGINQLETYFGLYLPQLFYSLLAPITLFIVVSFIDFISALVLFICVPLIPISIILVQKFAKKLLSKYWSSYTTLGNSFLENLQGLTTLKIYQSDEFKQQQMNKEAENFRKITMRVLIMQLNSISIMDIVAYGGAGLGSYFAITHYMNGSIGLFGALFIILMSFEFFIPLRQLGSFFHIAMNGIAASDKIMKILDIKQEQLTQVLKQEAIDIQVSSLSFQYNDDRKIIEDISFVVKPHQFVGIVGESGSGKSTIAKLLMGMYKHYDGEIMIQNQNRKIINDDSFLKRFVYITHEPAIFKGTLRDNLIFNQDISDDDIWKALKKVCLDEYFKNQDGLNTLILEGGSDLSGGQKQRLNLARALLKDSDVYIFDEATSNIDIESEENILSVIQELARQKTVIMITHRLSSVSLCDQILVMKNGCLIEQGTHQELLAHQQTYANLLLKQSELEVFQYE